MREIKFRAWDDVNKKMFYEFTISSVGEFMEHIGDEGQCHDNLNPVLMQYTGLKDKNGKEIYEGDILRSYYSLRAKGDTNVYRYSVVRWNRKQARFDGCWGSEIIGNIYENPELLESNK